MGAKSSSILNVRMLTSLRDERSIAKPNWSLKMTDTTVHPARVNALAAAVQAFTGQPENVIVDAANAFYGFLTGTTPAADAQKAPAKPGRPVKVAAAAAPAPEEKAAAAVVAKGAAATAAEDAAEGEPTTQQVGKAIADMIAANKKAECAALLSKYGAKSKSSLDPKNYSEFIADVESALLDA